MDNVTKGSKSPFEQIKKIDEQGNEYWSARELQTILGYLDFRNLENAIQKAIKACVNSGYNIFDHFVEVNDMISIGKGGKREVKDYNLSRYGCYLTIQNADSSKPMVALGQTYFAVQTRKQEIEEELSGLIEDERRLMLRNEMKKHNTNLAGAAKRAGVETSLDFAMFQNHGYKGLYGGLTMADIHQKKGLKKSQQILDHMGSTELAANLFRATQAEEKLKRDNIHGKDNANQVHFEVGQKVRQTIKDLEGTMPENLPTEESIKKVERKLLKHKK
jgi:DNA-damage-inducible protein D